MHTAEQVRAMADHSDAPQREMLLAYVDLLEAMEEHEITERGRRDLAIVRQRAAEKARNRK